MSKEQGRIEDITQQKVNDPATLTTMIQECKSMGCHVLTPVQKIDRIAPGHIVSMVAVRFDPDSSQHAYHDSRWGKNEVALTHTALVQLWVAAAGRWTMSDAVQSSEKHLVTWQAGGSVKEPGGQWIPEIDSRTEDYRDNADQVKGWSEKQLKEARARQFERTESFAKNRVIRKLLGVQQKYTKAELENPFIVVRTSYQPDPDHPLDRLFLLADAVGATSALYASPAFTGFLCKMAEGLDLSAKTALQETTAKSALAPPKQQQSLNAAPENGGAKTPPVDAEGQPPAEEGQLDLVEESVLDFSNSDNDGQLRTLRSLMQDRAYDPKALKKPVEKFAPDERVQFFRHLITLPKPQDPLAGELPFET